MQNRSLLKSIKAAGKPLSEIPIGGIFPARLENALLKAYIENLDDLAGRPTSEIRRIQGVGGDGITKIREVLDFFSPRKRQPAIKGVVAGFKVVVRWVGENKVFQTDTQQEAWQIEWEWKARARAEHWLYPLMVLHYIRFTTDLNGGEEELRDCIGYDSDIAKGTPAHKAFCICGDYAWRIGKIKDSSDKGKRICRECADEHTLIAQNARRLSRRKEASNAA